MAAKVLSMTKPVKKTTAARAATVSPVKRRKVKQSKLTDNNLVRQEKVVDPPSPVVMPKLARSKAITKQAKTGQRSKPQQDCRKILPGHQLKNGTVDSLDADLKASFSTQEECKRPPSTEQF